MSHRKLNFDELKPNSNVNDHLENRCPIILIGDHISKKRNIAALFRLADAIRAEKLIFLEDAPPTLNLIDKISRSTRKAVPFQFSKNPEEISVSIPISDWILLEYTNKSKAFNKTEYPEQLVLVMGNEQKGISPYFLEHCKKAIHIPMLGQNSSMNVIVATGIVAYEFLNQKALI